MLFVAASFIFCDIIFHFFLKANKSLFVRYIRTLNKRPIDLIFISFGKAVKAANKMSKACCTTIDVVYPLPFKSTLELKTLG